MPATLRDEIKSFRVRLGSAFGSLVFPSHSEANVPVIKDVFSEWLRAAEKKAGLPKLDGSLWHAYRRGWAIARRSTHLLRLPFRSKLESQHPAYSAEPEGRMLWISRFALKNQQLHLRPSRRAI